jgi:hypothetical protein
MAEIVESWQGYRYPSGQPLRPRPHWAKDMPTGFSLKFFIEGKLMAGKFEP